MSEAIIISIVSLLATGVSSIWAWLRARKKHNVELKVGELEFYKSVISDVNSKLDNYLRDIEVNSRQIYRLKRLLTQVLGKACLVSGCIKREFYSDLEIMDILKDMEDDEVLKNKYQLDNEIES